MSGPIRDPPSSPRKPTLGGRCADDSTVLIYRRIPQTTSALAILGYNSTYPIRQGKILVAAFFVCSVAAAQRPLPVLGRCRTPRPRRPPFHLADALKRIGNARGMI